MAERAGREPTILRILVVRSGGIAGISQRWQVEPGSGPDSDEWVALVTACPWGAVGSDPASRDRFVWRIEVSEARRMPRRVSGPARTAKVPDSQLIGPWRALVDRVQEVGSHG